MTNRSPTIFLTLMVLALQSACSSQDPRSPAAVDAPSEPPVIQAGSESGITVHRAQPKVTRALTPHSTGQSASSVDPKATGYLKAEVKYIGKGGIEANEVDQVLQSREAFSSALQALDEEGIRSLEAQDMSLHVRTVMEQVLGKEMTVNGLSCGMSVCMGWVQKGSAFDDAWAHAFLDHGSIKVFGFIEAADSTENIHERRFLFSFDPQLPAILVPRTL